MNETEFRHRLLDLAEDAPSRSSAPPALLRRARRRVVLTIASSVAIAILVVGMGIAGIRALQTAPTPADPPAPTLGRLGSLAYGIDGDIYVADWDGSNPVRIADGHPPSGGQACGPARYAGVGSIWSPDGRYLAYLHANCDGPRHAWWDVVISDPEGNVVTSFPSGGWGISWSPDSTRVAVWVRWGARIGIYGLDGERQVLTVPTGMLPTVWPGMGVSVNPVWLPDGASLMVPYGVEIPLDGSTPRRLPWADQDEGQAWVSPDGSRVAYLEGLVPHGVQDHQGGSFVVAAADGSHAQEVFGTRVGNPVWSPTGDRIAFTSGNGTELRVVDVATGTVKLLAEKDGSETLFVLDFSPEGDRILFSRIPEDSGIGPGSLWSVNADGSDLQRLVDGTALGDWQSLSPTR